MRSLTVATPAPDRGLRGWPPARRCGRRCRRCRHRAALPHRCAPQPAPVRPAARGHPGRLRRAHASLRAPGPSKRASTPSPVDFTRTPAVRCDRALPSHRGDRGCRRRAASPRSSASSVDDTMSVKRTVASTRSITGAARWPVTSSSKTSIQSGRPGSSVRCVPSRVSKSSTRGDVLGQVAAACWRDLPRRPCSAPRASGLDSSGRTLQARRCWQFMSISCRTALGDADWTS